MIPELETAKVDRVIEKGQVAEVEMYSAFYDPFVNPRVSDSGLAGVLKEGRVTDVYVVGLAGDYCVKVCVCFLCFGCEAVRGEEESGSGEEVRKGKKFG